MTNNLDKQAVLTHLNKILELELAGVVRYTQLRVDDLRLQPDPHRFLDAGPG